MSKKSLFITFILAFTLSPLVYAKFGDIVFDDKGRSLKKAGVPPAIFPHGRHEEIYKCNDCHPKIFKDKRGANDIDMKKNMSGQFCGAEDCHNSEKAFPLYQCKKCHIEKRASR